MPHIEVLPASTTVATPGWAYVPDTGYDPSKQAIAPTGARKRGRTSLFGTSSTSGITGANDQLTTRQQNKIAKHLAELDRENHRDVQIAIPSKSKDASAQRGSRGKMTPGVRKILTSQKTWRNYLDDEEAAIQAQAQTQTQTLKSSKASAQSQAQQQQHSSTEPMDVDAQAITDSHAMTGSNSTTNFNDRNNALTRPTHVSALDANIAILTKVETPTLPSADEIEALLSAPPLSYNAARVAPSMSSAPPRQFCEMCGYWGRAKCMKCGVRVCGLECKRQHEDTRCLKFYA